MRGLSPPGGTAPRPPSPPTLRRVRAAVFGELCSSFHPSRLCCLCRSWWPSPWGTQLTWGLLIFPFSHLFSPFPSRFPFFLLVFPFSLSFLPFPPRFSSPGSRLSAGSACPPAASSRCQICRGKPGPKGLGARATRAIYPLSLSPVASPQLCWGTRQADPSPGTAMGGVRDFSPHPTHGAPRTSAFPPVFWVSQPSPPSPGGRCLLTIKDIL